MSDWPVGLSTGCFYQVSIFDCLEAIRNGGFCMVEICSSPSHLDYHDHSRVKETAQRIQELGMEAYSFHAPFADEIDITALDEHQRQFAARHLFQAAEAAAELGVRYFVIHPGPEHSYRPPAEELLRRMQNAADTLNKVARRCQQLGVGFIVENMLPHLIFGNNKDMLWLMGAVDNVRVGACLDTGHAYLSGDLHNVMYKLSGHLQMIHANDNRGNNDDHLPPGHGNIQWRPLLVELARTGFHGGFVLELAGNREAAAILHDARRARQFLRNLSREIAIAVPPAADAAAAPL
ncbi:MAG: sugar phosphate isomerase/epimerase [Candidatus Hydrogenedentes bacterium]|nr:sugar phosphate isomerase/epimerase [Candidatus Hydrogenedentota bacterium]MBI3118723.1 sugar phosphate isomerase/epimerase [Candidatus Hydrogenedentota bacterium]